MNTFLQELFEKYEISDKDRHNILQMYNILSDDKKQNILNNFETLVYKIKKIEEDIKTEKEIILWDALDIVRNAIRKYRVEELNSKSFSWLE